MAEKVKRGSSSRWLYLLERVLTCFGQFGLVLASYAALERGNDRLQMTLRSGAQFHTFQFLVWQPFSTAIFYLVIGLIPCLVLLAISRSLRWGLRLKKENLAQAEIIQQLLQQQEEWAAVNRLREQEPDDDHIPPEMMAESAQHISF